MARKAKNTKKKEVYEVLDNNLRLIENLKSTGIYDELDEAILKRCDDRKPVLFKTVNKYLGTPALDGYLLNEQLYCLPTPYLLGEIKKELRSYRKKDIIEVGSGNGLFAHILDIQGTDTYLQTLPTIKKYYHEMGQIPITYRNTNIDRINDIGAIKKYEPKVVLATWVTDISRLDHGVDMLRYFDYPSVEKLVFVGNTLIHKNQEIVDVRAIDNKLCDSHDYDYHIKMLKNTISRSTTRGMDFMVVITRKNRSVLLSQEQKGIALNITGDGKTPLFNLVKELPNISTILMPRLVEKAQAVLGK